MHHELQEFGARRVRWWSAVLVLIGATVGALVGAVAALDAEWPMPDGVADRMLRWTVVGASVGAVGVLLLFLGADWSGARRAWPTIPLLPAPDLARLAEGISLARGEPVPRVWRIDSQSPNVACIPYRGGRHLIVSRGAEVGLERSELEAVMALQMSLLVDPNAARVRRAVVASGLTITWIIRLSILAMVVGLVVATEFAAVTVNVGVWAAIGLIALVLAVQRRVRWSWGMVGDGVAIETTRHPEPLVSALRRLAGHNAGPVPVRRTFGAADPYWAVPVRAHLQVHTSVNGRPTRSTSTEQQSDAALLLRAGIVHRVRLGGDLATVAAWRTIESVFDRIAEFGATNAGDGTIDGVTVTTEGATQGVLPPVCGSWPAADRGLFWLRTRRPRRPSSADLATYDAALTSGVTPF
jgi:Zn-dependent protease with chaperone function